MSDGRLLVLESDTGDVSSSLLTESSEAMLTDSGETSTNSGVASDAGLVGVTTLSLVS